MFKEQILKVWPELSAHMIDFSMEIRVVKCYTIGAFVLEGLSPDNLLSWCFKSDELDWRKMIAFESIGALF